MRATLDRPFGDAQVLGDGCDLEPLLPQGDEAGLGLQGVVLL